SDLRPHVDAALRYRIVLLVRGARLGPKNAQGRAHPGHRVRMERSGHSPHGSGATACLSRADRGMSDYLTRLAARTLKVAPLAQPRLTSWFEAGVTSQPRSVEVAAEDPGPVALSPSTAASNSVPTRPEPSI